MHPLFTIHRFITATTQPAHIMLPRTMRTVNMAISSMCTMTRETFSELSS